VADENIALIFWFLVRLGGTDRLYQFLEPGQDYEIGHLVWVFGVVEDGCLSFGPSGGRGGAGTEIVEEGIELVHASLVAVQRCVDEDWHFVDSSLLLRSIGLDLAGWTDAASQFPLARD
jgi:hypothetical protein